MLLKVLVEYDNEEWTTREWLQIYNDAWKLFLVEKNIVWAQRFDPNYPKRSLLWPALVRICTVTYLVNIFLSN